MRHQQNANTTSCKPSQDTSETRTRCLAKLGHHLIKYEIPRVHSQNASESQALLFPARKNVNGPVLKTQETTVFKRLVNSLADFLGRQSEVTEAKCDLIEDNRRNKLRLRILPYVSNATVMRRILKITAINLNRTALKLQGTREQPGQRRLSRTICPEQYDELSRCHIKRDSRERITGRAWISIAYVPRPYHCPPRHRSFVIPVAGKHKQKEGPGNPGPSHLHEAKLSETPTRRSPQWPQRPPRREPPRPSRPW